jgi:ABC-type Fe3+/spermidine/putrescine transport system ATPase subunit
VSETGLVTKGLSKAFGSHRVVRDLSLSLAKGEIVSLLGPSGCGKTTALRMVAGLERPDGGAIEILGRAVFGPTLDLPPEARNVGMVFQSYAVWPHRTVHENVVYPLRLKKRSGADALADEALARVHLEAMRDRFPGTLSGGQQQRVALARALAAEPALLLFDEPLSNLDQKLREEMRHEVRALAKRTGITTLYVTHDQEEAFAVSDRVAVVLEGSIAQAAAPHILYDEPADLRIGRFVGRLSVLGPVDADGENAARIGNARIPASFAQGAREASRRSAGVRPEAVSLVAEGSGSIAGRVLRSTFLGERREIAVETEAGELRADIGGGVRIEAGELVHLAIARCRVFAG